MRLFVALVPPPAVLDEVEEAVAPFRTTWPRLRWVSRDLWHVTLTFLGEVEERRLSRLEPRLERAAARYPPLDLSFAGAGAFPSGGRQGRVLWTGLYGDRRVLARLSASVAAAARRSGVATEQAVGGGRPPSGGRDKQGGGGTAQGGPERARKQRFTPHLTLARCREPMDLRPLVEALSTYAGRPWRAEEIHLVRSHLGPSPRYETLKSWPLGSSG